MIWHREDLMQLEVPDEIIQDYELQIMFSFSDIVGFVEI